MRAPESWTECKLGDLFSLVGGGTPSTKSDDYWGDGIPWFSSADIDTSGHILPRRRVTLLGIDKSTTNIVPSGTVVVVTRVGLGKLAILKEDMCFSQDIQGLVPIIPETINERYLYYCLQPLLEELKHEGRGTTISGITKKQLSDTTIRVPPLAEQHRIVKKIDSLFSKLDKGVESLQAIKQQLKTYQHILLKWAFDPRSGDVETTLSEIADIVGGITKGRDLSSQETLDLPYLRVANVQDGYLDLSVMKTIAVKKSEIDKYVLQVDDVLYTEGGDKDKLGRGTIWSGEIPVCVHQNHIFRARINEQKALAKYIALYSRSRVAKRYFFSRAKQTVNLASINMTVLKGLPLSLPSLAIQKEIVKTLEMHLSTYDKLEQLVDETLAKSDALRQSILKKAFEGRLVSQDPNDEPANTLLERIKAERATRTASTKRRKKNA